MTNNTMIMPENNSNVNLIENGYFEIEKKNKIKKYFAKKFQNLVEYFKYSQVRKEYMITPCNHVFHSDCLEKWIDKKLECPFCRSKLPSLE